MSLPGSLVQGDHEADRGGETAAGAGRGHVQTDPEEGQAPGPRQVLLQGLQHPRQGVQRPHRTHGSSFHSSLGWRSAEQSGNEIYILLQCCSAAEWSVQVYSYSLLWSVQSRYPVSQHEIVYWQGRDSS